MKRITALLLIPTVVATLSIFGCGTKEKTADNGKLKVIATTGMIADAVKMVAGDKVEIYGMMGPGVDPHLYKATKGDIEQFHNADIVFYNGLHLEAKLTDVFEKMSMTKTTVPVADGIPDSLLHHPKKFEGHPDPHVWFNLALWTNAVKSISATLVEKDAANAEFYQANCDRFVDSIITLHDKIIIEIQQIPKERRVLVTAHDAFSYFGEAYDIEVIGLQGISTVTEAGLYDVTQLVDLLVKRKIKAVFVESSVPRKSIEAVVEGCKADGHNVIIGGELFSDAMGERGTPEGTYLGMVRHNVNTIVNALK